jgi:hypothetical protein
VHHSSASHSACKLKGILTLLCGLVISVSRVALGSYLSFRNVAEALSEAHVPLCVWAIWAMSVILSTPITGTEAIAGLHSKLAVSRVASYGIGAIVLLDRLRVKLAMSPRDACVAVLPPLAAIVSALWGLNALMAALPKR